jgi:glycosyltransferase involved in cell wall biosynthesis
MSRLPEDMRKVLIITYWFPPSGGAGVQRFSKLVKYLSRYDWQPIVLAPLNPYYPYIDETLRDDIPPSVLVYHSLTIELTRFYFWLRSKLLQNNLVRRQSDREDEAASGSEGKDLLGRIRRGLLEAVLRPLRFINRWVFVPDTYVGWIPHTVLQGMRIARQHNVSVVVTTGAPWSTHIAGWLIKRLTNVPWVADFRDVWATGRQSMPSEGRFKLQERLERVVVREADRVTVTSQGMKSLYASKYECKCPDEFVTITNGFDPEDFQIAAERERLDNDRFRIVHTGKFTLTRRPDHFLQGIDRALDLEQSLSGDLEIVFVGEVDRLVLRKVCELDLTDVVTFVGYRNHKECIDLQVSADVLLVIYGSVENSRWMLQGKLFEYIGSRRPIMALTTDGPATRLLNKYACAEIVHPENINEICSATLKFYRKWRDERELVEDCFDSSRLLELERPYLAQSWARLFDDMSGIKRNED